MNEVENYFIDLVCDKCRTEIQASSDMIGQETECPACGAKMIIHEPESDHVVRHSRSDDDPDAVQAMKSRTIRIELNDL